MEEGFPKPTRGEGRHKRGVLGKLAAGVRGMAGRQKVLPWDEKKGGGVIWSDGSPIDPGNTKACQNNDRCTLKKPR